MSKVNFDAKRAAFFKAQFKAKKKKEAAAKLAAIKAKKAEEDALLAQQIDEEFDNLLGASEAA